MAPNLNEYKKYDDFYKEFHHRQGEGKKRIALPQKAARQSRSSWYYIIFSIVFFLLVIVFFITATKDTLWKTVKLQSIGYVIMPHRSPVKVDKLTQSDNEIMLCQEFNCPLYRSPWRQSTLTTDIYLKSEPGQNKQLKKIIAEKDSAIRDLIRSTISGSELYQVKDPKLTFIRSELERQISAATGQDMTGKLLIPRWNIQF